MSYCDIAIYFSSAIQCIYLCSTLIHTVSYCICSQYFACYSPLFLTIIADDCYVALTIEPTITIPPAAWSSISAGPGNTRSITNI